MTPEEEDIIIKLVDHHVRRVEDMLKLQGDDYKKMIDKHGKNSKEIMFNTVIDIREKIVERVNELEAKIFLLEKKIG